MTFTLQQIDFGQVGFGCVIACTEQNASEMQLRGWQAVHTVAEMRADVDPP